MSFWNGKSAVVTGGSSGLGLVIAKSLVDAGARVAIVARSAHTLEQAAIELNAASKSSALAIAADVTNSADVKRVMATTIAEFGKLDVLVNCAGISARGTIVDTSLAQFRELMELNFFALVDCTKAAIPHLLESRGHVVNIGSLASKSATRYMGGYAASKFAVAAFTQQLRLELSDQGLHALLVCPGPIASPERRVYAGSENLPESARKAGAGVKVSKIEPQQLAARILRACERRDPEIVMPAKARLLFSLSQLSANLGDWLVRKMTS